MTEGLHVELMLHRSYGLATFQRNEWKSAVWSVSPSKATHRLSDLKCFINFSQFLICKTCKQHKFNELLLEIEIQCVKYLT